MRPPQFRLRTLVTLIAFAALACGFAVTWSRYPPRPPTRSVRIVAEVLASRSARPAIGRPSGGDARLAIPTVLVVLAASRKGVRDRWRRLVAEIGFLLSAAGRCVIHALGSLAVCVSDFKREIRGAGPGGPACP
jgi:hypothetical protein